MLLKTVLALFLVLLHIPSHAQLVNIESRRMQSDSLRFVLQGNVSGSYTDINGSTIFQTRPSLSTQFKSIDLDNVFFIVGDYRLLRTSDRDIANAWLLHLRYNRKMTSLITIEAFIQSQHDRVLAIKSRNLGGAGLRLQLLSSENASIFVGQAYIYERERANFVDETIYHHRNSSYVTLTATIPNTSLSFTNTFYYQPLYEDFGDYRLLEQFKASVSISKVVDLFVLFDYYYDSITPEDQRQFSSTTSAGLGVNL